MSLAEVYEASPVNPRRRATRDEMEERAQFYIRYAAAHGPITVRQLYYHAGVASPASTKPIKPTPGSSAKCSLSVVLAAFVTNTSPTRPGGCASPAHTPA